MVKVTERGRKAQWVVPSSKVWYLSHLWCLSKSQCLSFWQAHTLDQWKTCSLSPLNTHQHHINDIVNNLFNKCSNYTMFKLYRTRIQTMHFAVFISDTPVTLKQRHGRQAWNENAGPKQGYDQAKFERSCINGVWEKANLQMRKYVNYFPWTCVKIKYSGIVMIYLT